MYRRTSCTTGEAGQSVSEAFKERLNTAGNDLLATMPMELLLTIPAIILEEKPRIQILQNLRQLSRFYPAAFSYEFRTAALSTIVVGLDSKRINALETLPESGGTFTKHVVIDVGSCVTRDTSSAHEIFLLKSERLLNDALCRPDPLVILLPGPLEDLFHATFLSLRGLETVRLQYFHNKGTHDALELSWLESLCSDLGSQLVPALICHGQNLKTVDLQSRNHGRWPEPGTMNARLLPLELTLVQTFLTGTYDALTQFNFSARLESYRSKYMSKLLHADAEIRGTESPSGKAIAVGINRLPALRYLSIDVSPGDSSSMAYLFSTALCENLEVRSIKKLEFASLYIQSPLFPKLVDKAVLAEEIFLSSIQFAKPYLFEQTLKAIARMDCTTHGNLSRLLLSQIDVEYRGGVKFQTWRTEDPTLEWYPSCTNWKGERAAPVAESQLAAYTLGSEYRSSSYPGYS